MSKSNYEEVRKLYEMCKEKIYYIDDVSEFIKKAENEEEKEFYTLVSDLFLQTEQKEAIKKGVF